MDQAMYIDTNTSKENKPLRNMFRNKIFNIM